MSIVRALCHDVHEPGVHRNEDLRMGPIGMFQGIYLSRLPLVVAFRRLLPYGGFPAPLLGRENLFPVPFSLSFILRLTLPLWSLCSFQLPAVAFAFAFAFAFDVTDTLKIGAELLDVVFQRMKTGFPRVQVRASTTHEDKRQDKLKTKSMKTKDKTNSRQKA